MKKIIVIFILTLLILSIVLPVYGIKNEIKDNNVQLGLTSNVEWSLTYGENRFEMLDCIQQTSDGGYIACGVKSPPDTTDIIYRPWVIKTDNNGVLEWEWSPSNIGYEGNYFNWFPDCYCTFIKETNNGGFITGFRLLVTQNFINYWLCGFVKLSADGVVEWIETCTDNFEWSFSPYQIIEFDDNSFLSVGMSCNANYHEYDYDFAGCLYKIDSTGIEQWRKEYNYSGGRDETMAIFQTNDNGYFLTGYVTNGSNVDYWMIKTDSNGNELWNKTIGGEDLDYCYSRNCYQTSDNGFIMAGCSRSYGSGRNDVWIVKTDSIGNLIWDKTYGDIYEDECYSVESINDKEYILCITKNLRSNSGDKDDIHLVNIDINGNIGWVQEFGGNDRQIGQYVSKTSDGGLIVCGRTGSYFMQSSDGLIVKFAQFDNERPEKPDKPSGPRRGEPNIEYTFTTSSTDPDGDPILYKWNWGDGTYSDLLDSNEASYTWSYAGKFNVRVMAIDEKGGESEWSDPLQFSTPKIKSFSYFNLLISRLIQRFPILELLQ